MKIFLFALMLAALTAGLARAGWDNSACADRNGRACTDARNAFAEHHGGMFPEQYAQNHHGRHHHWKGHHHELQNSRHREDR